MQGLDTERGVGEPSRQFASMMCCADINLSRFHRGLAMPALASCSRILRSADHSQVSRFILTPSAGSICLNVVLKTSDFPQESTNISASLHSPTFTHPASPREGSTLAATLHRPPLLSFVSFLLVTPRQWLIDPRMAIGIHLSMGAPPERWCGAASWEGEFGSMDSVYGTVWLHCPVRFPRCI